MLRIGAVAKVLITVNGARPTAHNGGTDHYFSAIDPCDAAERTRGSVRTAAGSA